MSDKDDEFVLRYLPDLFNSDEYQAAMRERHLWELRGAYIDTHARLQTAEWDEIAVLSPPWQAARDALLTALAEEPR